MRLRGGLNPAVWDQHSMAVVLMKGGFTALAPWQWAYGVGYSLLSIAAAAWWARGRFQRYVVERAAA